MNGIVQVVDETTPAIEPSQLVRSSVNVTPSDSLISIKYWSMVPKLLEGATQVISTPNPSPDTAVVIDVT